MFAILNQVNVYVIHDLMVHIVIAVKMVILPYQNVTVSVLRWDFWAKKKNDEHIC